MSQRFEGYFEGYDGCQLFYQRWGHPKAIATLIITHGQAEHSGCYHRLIQFLEDNGTDLPLEIYAWDLRGHGKSDGLRGYAKDFHEYVQDYDLFLKHLELAKIPRPLYLLGHSMGGLIQFRGLCSEHGLGFKVAGQILSAPMFDISVQVPAYKEKAADMMNLILPKLTLSNEINFADLTRDAKVLKEYEQDTLRHDRISAGVFLGAQRAMSEVRSMASRVKIPTLLVMSDQDPVTSTPAALDIISKMDKGTTKIQLFPQRKHEIFNDLEREEVFLEIKKFIIS